MIREIMTSISPFFFLAAAGKWVQLCLEELHKSLQTVSFAFCLPLPRPDPRGKKQKKEPEGFFAFLSFFKIVALSGVSERFIFFLSMRHLKWAFKRELREWFRQFGDREEGGCKTRGVGGTV